jgi:hypothetical protein
MESTTVTQTVITQRSETFTRGTYNGVAVLVRNKDGYINATKIARDNNKDMHHYFRNKTWAKIVEIFKRRTAKLGPRNPAGQDLEAKYELKRFFFGEVTGTYVHPDLVHFIAEWCNLEYAFTVQEIMNSINKTLHAELEKQRLPDTVENAKPVLEKVKEAIKEVKLSAYEERMEYAKQAATTEAGFSHVIFNIVEERESERQTWGGFK